jgi:hypothetical protein
VATRHAATEGRLSLWSLVLWPLVLPGLLAAPGARYDTSDPVEDAAVIVGPLAAVGVPPADLRALSRGLRDLDRRIASLDAELARHDARAITARRDRSTGDARVALEEQLGALAALADLRDRLREGRDAATARIDGLSARLALQRAAGEPGPDVGATLRAVIAAVDEAGRAAARES